MLLYVVMTLDRIPLLFQSPEEAYADFLDTTDQAEDMLMDPLILAGQHLNAIPYGTIMCTRFDLGVKQWQL